MPYARKPKTSYKKRRVTRRKPATKRTYASRRNTNNRGNVRVGGTVATVQKGYLPLGRTYFAKLPYVDNWAINADGTTGTSNVTATYSSNNVYDPLYNTGGHQPLQFDVLAAHYERCWVWGAAVELTFSNPEADGMWVGYRVRSSTNPTTTINRTLSHIQEMRDSAIRPINNSGRQATTFKFYVSNPKVLGVTKTQYSDVDYSHMTIGNPTIFNWIEPYAIHTVAGQTSSVRANIKLTYYVQFTNPISESQN